MTAPLFGDPREWGYRDSNTVFFDWSRPVPVYHGFDWARPSDDGPVTREKTRCGLLISEYNSDTQRLREPGLWLPLRHAVKFAKPCRKCFATDEVSR